MENGEQSIHKLDLMIFLEDFLKAAKRFWMLLILLVCVCSVGLFAYRRMGYHATYEAYASFMVRVANPLYANVSGYNSKTAEVMAATFPSIVTSGVLQKQVMEDLNVTRLPNVSVSAMGGSSIITMRVRDADPEFAYAVLNSVIDHYPDVAKFVLGPTELELLDESGVPTRPHNLFNAASNMVEGGIIGAFLWCAVVACMALLKNTVRSEDELREILNFGYIVQIPDVRPSKRQTCPLIIGEKRSSSLEEAIRLLRIRVEKSMEEGGKKVLLISSAIPGEGKTTISVNLAISLAQKGKQVLLIDCDLRNPSVSKALKLSSKNNMVDFLKRKVTIKDMVQTSAQPNLFVISGGNGTQSEEITTLAQERTNRLVFVAQKFYDYVILDTPPCSMLADASEVAELAECGLMVVKQDYAAKDQIMDGVQRLNEGDLQLIGCVFNRVGRSFSGDYGYGYGYGTGYGSKQ